MSTTKKTSLSVVAPRCTDDVARLYVEARTVGLGVTHYRKAACLEFDGLPEPGCQLGVFREVGHLIFHKDERRWEVKAYADAGAVDLATLLDQGIALAAGYGRHPGHLTRKRIFRHKVREDSGQRIAWTRVCYKLNVDDLMGHARQAAEESVDDAQLLELLSGGVE